MEEERWKDGALGGVVLEEVQKVEERSSDDGGGRGGGREEMEGVQWVDEERWNDGGGGVGEERREGMRGRWREDGRRRGCFWGSARTGECWWVICVGVMFYACVDFLKAQFCI